jgi:Do/DeqQ family serine protease
VWSSTQAERRSPVVQAVEQASPAVVNISTTQIIEQEISPSTRFRDPFFDQFFRDFFEPRRQRYTRTSLGSGVIIREDGFVLTNMHVVLRAAHITVTLADQREFEATLVGSDADSDLAVLKLAKAGPVPAARMGTSSDLMIGETVIAIGNPFGLSHTVTTGVVSAVGRSLRSEGQAFYDLIQTDASINPGNSGGPLLNITGELIGINTAIYQAAQGIGFAIPIDRARRIVSDLIAFGEVQPAWTGLLVRALPRDVAALLKGVARGGVLVQGVELDSPAVAAGIEPGDVLLEIGGHTVQSVDEWETRVRDQPVGARLRLALLRDQQRLEVQLQTSRFPIERADRIAWSVLGLRVRERGGRVEVEAVRPGSPAAEIGIRAGDLIVGLGGQAIADVDGFRRRLIDYRNAQRVLVSVQRGRRLYQVPMPLGGVS